MVSPCLTSRPILKLAVFSLSLTHDAAFSYIFRIVLEYLDSTLQSSNESNIDYVTTESNASLQTLNVDNRNYKLIHFASLKRLDDEDLMCIHAVNPLKIKIDKS